MIKQNFIFVVMVMIVIAFIFYLFQWKDAGLITTLVPKTQADCYAMVHQNSKSRHTQIKSMNHIFEIYYVKNVQKEDPFACSPYFPAIHIYLKNETCTAWLQIIRTDSPVTKLNCFIDSHAEIFPLYSINTDFYDFPQWTYSFFNKPLSFWRAQTFAVQIDHTNKIIRCLGGISWGFELSYFHFQPKMILPQALSESDWRHDWEIYFQKFFSDYSMIIS